MLNYDIFSQNITLYIYQLQHVQVIGISRFNYQIMMKKFSKSGCNLEKIIYKNKIINYICFMTITHEAPEATFALFLFFKTQYIQLQTPYIDFKSQYIEFTTRYIDLESQYIEFRTRYINFKSRYTGNSIY